MIFYSFFFGFVLLLPTSLLSAGPSFPTPPAAPEGRGGVVGANISPPDAGRSRIWTSQRIFGGSFEQITGRGTESPAGLLLPLLIPSLPQPRRRDRCRALPAPPLPPFWGGMWGHSKLGGVLFSPVFLVIPAPPRFFLRSPAPAPLLFLPFSFFLRSRGSRVAPEPSGSGLSLLPRTEPEPPPLPAPNPRKMPHLSPLPTSCPSAQPGEAETPKGPTLTPLLPP